MPDNKVLIIDDDQRICRLIKRVADRMGVESVTIDQSVLFDSTYRDYGPNLILMDLQMPQLDGIEILRELAAQQSEAAIILTSGMDKSVVETAEELGKSLGLNMAGILPKPIEIDRVKEVLESHFGPFKKRRLDLALELTEDELLRAIEQNELRVYYQPQIKFESGAVMGVEALVRWQHPEHGLIFPDSFIPLAEKSQALIGELTYCVLETALRDDERFRECGIELNISVNLSAILLGDLSLPDRVEEVLKAHHFDPERLLLEVTESGAMENPSLTMDILTRLRLKGIRLSLDDFGTGFSSLVQLYRMPFNEIKIDKSFVMMANESEEAAAIARITIDLGHSLGLEVVAEGIEDQKCYDWLKGLECDIGQGYLISRPVSVSNFLNWMDEHPTA